MRVLFCSHPGLGHFFPLVQLAWSFRTLGHDVIVTIAEHQDRAAAAGLEVVNVAPDFNAVAIFEQVAKDNPEFFETVATRPAINLEEWGVQIAAVNRPLFERTMHLTDAWKPDLVVYDQGTTVGLFAAARAGVPAVQRNMSAWRTNRMHEAVASFLTDLSGKYAVDLPKPDVIVESFPPSMLTEEPEGWFMRWVPYSGGAVLGDRLPPKPTRPLVAISMGTVELLAMGFAGLEPIIAAASETDADFVLAAGDADTSALGTLPDNVRSIGWTPLHVLLQSCAAIIHHGGGGTALTALDAGIPQLVAPHPADQFQHTTLNSVRARGVGLVAQPDEIDADLLRKLLTDESIRTATTEVQAEIQSLPTPAETTRRILQHLR